MNPLSLDELKKPLCNPFIPQVGGSEESFTKYITKKLEEKDYSVSNEVTIQKEYNRITLDIIAEKLSEKKYIEVKWLRYFNRIAKAVGQILWYSHLLKEPIFLALWCGYYSDLGSTEIEFLESTNIPLILVSPDDLRFFNQISWDSKFDMCQDCPLFRGFTMNS